MCGFFSTDAMKSFMDEDFYPEWSLQYKYSISEECVAEARRLAFEDIDANRYSCSSFSYHSAVCIYTRSDELYNAYMACQKLASFKRNDE